MPQPPAGAVVPNAEAAGRVGLPLQNGLCPLYTGIGVPTFAVPDGAVYIRYDGVVGGFIYQRRAGAWVPTAA